MITKKKIEINSNIKGFVEYKPDNWDGVKKLPLIIFWHGLNQTGTNLDSIMTLGLPLEIQSGRFNEEAVVLMPQCSIAWPAWFVVEGVIDYALTNYAIDPDRISLTGLSMGGAAILDFAEGGNVSRIAAIAPVCPASVPQAFGSKFVENNIPIWFTCGDKDSLLSNSKAWVQFVNDLKINPKSELYIVPNTDHNSWGEAYRTGSTEYGGTSLVKWLLSKKRGTVATPTRKAIGSIDVPGFKVTLFNDKTYENASN